MIFTRLARTNRAASTLALAVALTAGGIIGSAAFEAPAQAQKKDKKEKAPKADYSQQFIEAYRPIEELTKAATPDWAAVKAAIPGLIAASTTADDKNATGSLVYTAGVNTKDNALALQGMDMMLQSGKVGADKLGQFNFAAGQLAYQLNQYAQARTYFTAAAEAGYTENDPKIFVAESYFAENQAQQGLDYLSQMIEAKRAAGQPVDQAWIKRGLAMAYNNKLPNQVAKYSTWFVTDFPGEESWGDAVAILLNTGGYQNPEILDLLRLGRRAEVMREGPMYLEYVEAADYRRLPAEVVAVIDEGYANGKLDKTDPYVADTRKQAEARATSDRAEISSLLANAQKGGAALNTVLTAGDAALGMGRAADAEGLYAKAVAMPGADKALVLTRLGIAQFDQGKYAEAQATFEKVEGTRKPIANLWAMYSKQKAGGGA